MSSPPDINNEVPRAKAQGFCSAILKRPQLTSTLTGAVSRALRKDLALQRAQTKNLKSINLEKELPEDRVKSIDRAAE